LLVIASFKKCRATVPPRSRKTPELIPEVSSKADFGTVPLAPHLEHMVFREDWVKYSVQTLATHVTVHISVFIFARVFHAS